MEVVFSKKIEDTELPVNSTVKHSHSFVIEVTDVKSCASDVIRSISDTSWIADLDVIPRMSYEETAIRTIGKLVSLFEKVENEVTTDFGEFMISLGAGRCLESELNHTNIPLSELWKEKKSNNHGFDFHTVSPNEKINFGEAKYNSNQNSYTSAAKQINRFIDDGKDKVDAVHLLHLSRKGAVDNLAVKKRGFIVAFSLHSDQYEKILSNAIKSDAIQSLSTKSDELYLIGVKA